MIQKLMLCVVLLIFLSLAACKSSSKTTRSGNRTTTTAKKAKVLPHEIVRSEDVKALQADMAGSYSSISQAKADSTYLDISLHMYPIWTTKEDSYLYVEQALSSTQDKPYRQRIYKLEKDGNGGFMSHVYTFSNPAAAVGQWKTPAYFDQFDLTILEEREGCTVYLTKHADGSYSGSTRLDHCKSSLRGATYATSVVKIRENSIMSWDQGFDADGNQVWGAEKGGYRFERASTAN